MGDGNFRPPPTESAPLDRSPKKLVQVIMPAATKVVPNLVGANPSMGAASGQIGEI